jgi:Outer membrane protein
VSALPLLLCVSLFVLAALGQAPELKDTTETQALLASLPPRVGVMGEVQITLDEVVASVLANNQNIQSAELARRVARLDLIAARAAYDPTLTFDTRYLREVIPVTSAIATGEEGRITSAEGAVIPGISALIPGTGGSYQTTFTSIRRTTDNQFTLLNPQYPTALTFNLTFPLLRGFRFDQTRLNIEVSRSNVDLSTSQLRQTVTDTITAAVQAYWELYFARQDVIIRARAVDAARRQVESNERLAAQGILAPIGVVEARAQVATFEQTLFASLAALTRAENQLKTLMLGDRRSPLWRVALLPVTAPPVDPPAVNIEDAVTTAIAERPELRQVEISADINRYQTRLAREQTRPQLDFLATYTTAGLAGTPVLQQPNPFLSSTQILFGRVNELSALAGLPPLPSLPDVTAEDIAPLLVGGYGQSLRNLLRQEFPTVQVGLRFSFPIRNRAAEANLSAAVLEGRRIETQRQQVEQQIQAEVRNYVEDMMAARRRLQAARAGSTYAREQYESEQRQFRAGLSTVFLVLQRQTEYFLALSQEVRAGVDLAVAIENYRRATAQTLPFYGIRIQP